MRTGILIGELPTIQIAKLLHHTQDLCVPGNARAARRSAVTRDLGAILLCFAQQHAHLQRALRCDDSFWIVFPALREDEPLWPVRDDRLAADDDSSAMSGHKRCHTAVRRRINRRRDTPLVWVVRPRMNIGVTIVVQPRTLRQSRIASTARIRRECERNLAQRRAEG